MVGGGGGGEGFKERVLNQKVGGLINSANQAESKQ